MSRILVLSFSDLARDPRVDRQIEFLQSDYEVIAAGLAPPQDPRAAFVDLSHPSRPFLAEGLRQAGSLASLLLGRYEQVYWRHPDNRAAVQRLAHHGADLVIANDLAALPLACRVAGGAPVVFDAHELSTEEHADRLWWRTIMRPYADALLRAYLPRTTAMITVAPGIAERYADGFGVDPVVITNAPPMANLAPTAVGRPIRLVHHGGADPQRRIELMIEAMDLLDDRFELSLMLMPSHPRYLGRLRRMAARRDRVRFVAPAPQRQIVAACNQYDAGVYLLPPGNENLRHALPNKLFEFIQSRLAVAIGPSPEMAKIVRERGCGVVAEDFSPRGLADALNELTPERVSAYKQASHRAAAELNAESNRGRLLSLISRALSG